MEEVVARSSSIPPPLPPKTRNRTQQLSNSSNSSSSSGEILTTFTFPEMRSVNLVSAQQQHQQQIQEQQQQPQGHVVKIRINPEQESVDYTPTDGCIRISVNGTSSLHNHHHHETVIDTSVGGGDDGILRRSGEKSSATVVATSTPDRGAPGAPYYFYNSFPSASMVISSGQSSPSDTLDSGTCSDLDGSTPPPLPKKTSAASPPPPPRPVATAVVNTAPPAAPGGSTVVGNTVTVTVNGGVSASSPALTAFHQRNGSLTSSGADVDSEDEEVDDDRISCDSLNSRELALLSVSSATATNDSGIVLSLVGPSVDKITVNGQDGSPSLTDSGIDRDAPQPPVVNMPVSTSPPPPPPPPVAEVPPAAPTPPTKRQQRPEGGCILPQSLLNDIRERSAKLNSVANGNGIANGSGSLKKKVTRTWKDVTPATSPSTEEAPVQPKLKPLSIVPIYDDSTPVKKTTLVATPEAEESETDGTPQQVEQPQQQPPPPVPKKPTPNHVQQNGLDQKVGALTKNVVIVERDSPPSAKKTQCVVQERTYEDRKKEWDEKQQQIARQQQLAAIRGSFKYEADRFYNFHLNEHAPDDSVIVPTSPTTPTGRRDSISSNCSSILLQDDGLPDAEETFAGLKNISNSSTIRSAKGTVRGVKNRVRAGIATFLQIQDTKNYKEKEAGKVVVYTTTMGVVRETYQACLKVRNILRTLLVRCEERDVFMSREVQTELRERMRSHGVVVPQVFVDGQHLGDAETIERLNESGELRRIMKPFKDPTVCHTCQVCGGFRLLPCSVCNGSKKSMHRNHFTSEFVALKCMHCDEVGLVRCYACS